jgi:hypothetical protein
MLHDADIEANALEQIDEVAASLYAGEVRSVHP